mmetsp:Transcript_19571/g.43628  ORF Transcript_19571/g.43628 Transcript_19571/m.43628 type:complete len:267 (-) Transcript_19571:984-1784(-)
MPSIGEVRILCPIKASSNRLRITTTEPSVSFPRRPARPAICSSWLVLSLTISELMRFVTEVMTVVLAGIFTPAASVSVANRTLILFALKRSSMNPFQTVIKPAWCTPTPERSICTFTLSTGMSGLARMKRASAALMYSTSAAVRSFLLDCITFLAACSQPARLKMNTIAGSCCSRCSSSTTSLYCAMMWLGLGFMLRTGREDLLLLPIFTSFFDFCICWSSNRVMVGLMVDPVPNFPRSRSTPAGAPGPALGLRKRGNTPCFIANM